MNVDEFNEDEVSHEHVESGTKEENVRHYSEDLLFNLVMMEPETDHYYAYNKVD